MRATARILLAGMAVPVMAFVVPGRHTVKNNDNKPDSAKACTGWYYKADKKGNITDKKYKYSYEEYDLKGNELLSLEFSSSGKLVEKTVHEYDQLNGLLKTTRFDGNGKITWMHTYVNDETGKHRSGTSSDAKGELHTCQWIYDQNGRLIEQFVENTRVDDPDDPANAVYLYTYMGETEEIDQVLEYDIEMNATWGNKKGYPVKNEYMINKLMTREMYFYDKNGNLTEIAEFGIREYRGKTCFKYNDKGQCAELISYDYDNKIEYVIKYEYEYY